MVDTQIYNIVELFSVCTDELLDLFFTHNTKELNFCNDEVITYVFECACRLIEADPHRFNIIFTSCDVSENWRSDKRGRVMSSVYDELQLGTDNINNGLYMFMCKLSKRYKCVEVENVDYLDFTEIATKIIGSQFVKHYPIKFANFIDNCIYYHDKPVIIEYTDIPDYVIENVRRQLKLNEII